MHNRLKVGSKEKKNLTAVNKFDRVCTGESNHAEQQNQTDPAIHVSLSVSDCDPKTKEISMTKQLNFYQSGFKSQ